MRALVIFIREKADEARRTKPSSRSRWGDAVVKSHEHKFRLETVADGLETPWSMAFLPDGRMLVTERRGACGSWRRASSLPEAVAGMPPVWAEGQGGLLDVAVAPGYATNGWIYLSFTDPGAGRHGDDQVVRGRLREDRWSTSRRSSRRPMASTGRGQVHFGSRFVFDEGLPLLLDRRARARWTTRRTSRGRTARCTASTTTAACPRTTRS